MESHDYLRYIPSWKRWQEPPDSPRQRLQENPSDAMAASASRAKFQNLLSVVTMVMVLAVVAVGTRLYNERTQRVDVSAAATMKKTVRGTVASVDYKANSFSLLFESSEDPAVSAQDIPRWKVSLPPGEKFLGTQGAPFTTCFRVTDLQTGLKSAKGVTCASVVQPGNTVLVEYVILTPGRDSMVAKRIIGQSSK